MKIISKYVWSLLLILFVGLSACGDDDLQFSDQKISYIQKNEEYIWKKKSEKDENGKLIYSQVVIGKDTALYRITNKEHNWTTQPDLSSHVYLLNLEGRFIDGNIFQPKLEKSDFDMNILIPGLCGILTKVHLDETIEAIIPASLGYGYDDQIGIPGGSTLIFTFTLDKVK